MADFEKVQYVRQCCFSILPQLYCDKFSITEQIGKIVTALNKLIENNNKLEDYLKEIIREVIESGEIEEIIKDILANYILNVKFPPEGIEPASGDGTKDDTVAIQGCIDYANANGGKAVYFPSGKYLTQSLNLKDNVSLFGFDRSTTYLVHKGGAINPLLSGTCSNNTLSGLTFDGNMTIQVNNINTVVLTGGKYVINNCKFTDGYETLLLNLNDSVEINDCNFESAVETLLHLTGYGIVNAKGLTFEKLSTIRGMYAIDNFVDNACYTNIYSTCETVNAIRNTSNGSVFIGKILNSDNTHINNGNDNYYDFYSRGGSVKSLITTETTERINGDNALNALLDTERAERITTNTALNSKIDVEIAERINSDGAINNKLKEKASEYVNVEAMKADTALTAGDYAHTLGYYSINDNGASYYIIAETLSGWGVELTNGLYAKLIYGSEVLVEQLGCKASDVDFDNGEIINNFINGKERIKIKFGNGYYHIKTGINIDLSTNYGLQFSGIGSTGSVLVCSSSTATTIFKVNGENSYSNSITFADFGIIASNNVNEHTAIKFEKLGSSLNKNEVRNLKIIDFYRGVVIDSSRLIYIKNVGFWTSGIDHIAVTILTSSGFSGDLYFNDCQFSTYAGNNANHIYMTSNVNNIAGIHIVECTFYDTHRNIYGICDNDIADIWITSCAFDRKSDNSIFFESIKDNAKCINISVNNCYFTAPTTPLLIYLPGSNSEAYSNKFINNYVNGASGTTVLLNPTMDSIVSGNFLHNSIGASNENAGIRMYNCNGAIASNNSITDTSNNGLKAIEMSGEVGITTGNVVVGYTGENVIINSCTKKSDTGNLI